jgi:hypothetical protein
VHNYQIARCHCPKSTILILADISPSNPDQKSERQQRLVGVTLHPSLPLAFLDVSKEPDVFIFKRQEEDEFTIFFSKHRDKQ